MTIVVDAAVVAVDAVVESPPSTKTSPSTAHSSSSIRRVIFSVGRVRNTSRRKSLSGSSGTSAVASLRAIITVEKNCQLLQQSIT
jgi:hypothetical protein